MEKLVWKHLVLGTVLYTGYIKKLQGNCGHINLYLWPYQCDSSGPA